MASPSFKDTFYTRRGTQVSIDWNRRARDLSVKGLMKMTDYPLADRKAISVTITEFTRQDNVDYFVTAMENGTFVGDQYTLHGFEYGFCGACKQEIRYPNRLLPDPCPGCERYIGESCCYFPCGETDSRTTTCLECGTSTKDESPLDFKTTWRCNPKTFDWFRSGEKE